MAARNVLVVEDDEVVRTAVRRSLDGGEYTVFMATNVMEALNILRVKTMDVILLDRTLPDGDGLELLRRIRRESDVPVIIVSSKGEWVDKVVGLELGADDYIGKPFIPRELQARVKAAMRRHELSGEGAGKGADELAVAKWRVGKWILDTGRLEVYDAAGKSAGLTLLEFKLLEAMAVRPGRVMTRDQLINCMRGHCAVVGDRAVDIHVARLRRKIGDDSQKPEIIKTIRGGGYMVGCSTELLV